MERLLKLTDLPTFAKGECWLVGAGSGDASLITVLGMHAICSADVIFYDNLVNDRLLSQVKARLEFVGKKAGKCARTQQQINQMLVDSAKQGERVVRLKGGDPMVFSRGGEEIEALAHHRIKYRIVPGVSSATAAPAYAGIPITHRHYNSAVTLITGHDAKGKLPEDLAWDALARLNQPLIFFMSLTHLEEISSELIKAKMNPATEAVIIANATMAQQKVYPTTLSQLAECRHRHNIKSPALVMVGEITRLHKAYQWFNPKEQKGQFGKL